jgi:hypothetical protein
MSTVQHPPRHWSHHWHFIVAPAFCPILALPPTEPPIDRAA